MNRKTSTVYLIHGNTYYDGYGHEESVFGIYTDKHDAEMAKEKIINTLFNEEMENELTDVRDIFDIDVRIMEIDLNHAVNIYLGGYVE